ncbi:unnamed protein product [Allacma fusca]|uniref:Uncharacterized protein n=1 Tax=Allacma fusca TaxID=39272 RepID=A0A8J2LH75_9HEXA|nr:unnamed protein product [Allacma fusca]
MEMFRHLFSCDKTRWSAHEFVDDRKDKRSLQWTTTHGHGYSGMMSQNPNGHNGQNCISRKKRRIKIGDLSSTSSSSSSSSWVQGGCGGKDRKRSMKNSWTRKWTSGECSGELGVDELTWKQQSGSGLSTRLLYMIVILISTASYWNSFNGDFVHDDLSAIKTNGDVTGQNSIWDIFFNDFWGKPMADRTSHKSYRPLTILSFR